MNIIQQQLEFQNGKFQLGFDTLTKYHLENIEYFTKEDLYTPTKKELKYVDKCIPKNCFNNCIYIAKKDSSFKYYEGYYVFEEIGFAFEHGFLVKDNKVFDPTSFLFDGKMNIILYGGTYIPTNELKLNLGYSNFFPYLKKLGKIPEKVAIF